MFLNLKSNFPQGTKILANYMGWFNGSDGKKHAANVCQSDDPRTINSQVQAAHAVGIDGFVVDWYGGITDYALPTNKATLLLASACESFGMEFSIMLDSGVFKWASDKKAAFASALLYAKSKYFPIPNYTKLNGKPVLWEFGWSQNGINPGDVGKAHVDMAILSQNSCPVGVSGSFAWVNGFGSPNAPKDYMDYYLGRKDPVMVPCIFDGFDDHDPVKTTQSRWGGPARSIAYGQWQMCIDEINKAIAAGKKFPFIQICTWNDYDERTQIESQCLNLEGLRLY